MSEEAKKTIETIKQGKLPPLNTTTTKGKQSSQRGIDHSTYGLQYLNEGANVSLSKKNKDK